MSKVNFLENNPIITAPAFKNLGNVQPLSNALRWEVKVYFVSNRYGKMKGEEGIRYTVT